MPSKNIASTRRLSKEEQNKKEKKIVELYNKRITLKAIGIQFRMRPQGISTLITKLRKEGNYEIRVKTKTGIATKIINGKKFLLLHTYKTNPIARYFATVYKSQGRRLARVIQSSSGWDVWVHPIDNK